MRRLLSLVLILTLPGCASTNGAVFGGLPPTSDIMLGAGAAYLLFGDDLENIKKEDIDPKEAAPPQAKSTAHRVANKVRDNVRATSRHMKDWWFYDPSAQQAKKSVPNSYCYRTQGDVLCYRAPMPGWEHRLVGYQGTFAEAPPSLMMQPLPGQSVDPAMLPANRVANAKPVFTELPPEAKEEAPKDPAQLLQADPDSVQETIPDPSTSPQL